MASRRRTVGEGSAPPAIGRDRLAPPRPRPGRPPLPRTDQSRRDQAARDPGDDRAENPRGPRPPPPPRCPGPSLPRGRSSPPNHAAAYGATSWRRRPNSPGATKLRVIIAGDEPVTLSKLERAFVALPAKRHAAAADHQQARRRPAGRLPLARAPPDRRAQQLPVPQLASQLGAGLPPRKGGATPRRRVSPLHLERRLRGLGADAAGAARTSSGRYRALDEVDDLLDAAPRA